MKRTKRSLALISVFALLLNLFSMPLVSAEESEISYVGPTLKVNSQAVVDEVVIASVDFKVDSRATHGFALRFIPTIGGTPMGAVRMNPHGFVMMPGGAVAWDGSWMDSYTATNNWSHGTYIDDTTHNIKLRLEKGAGTTGIIDYYLDDVWVYRASGDLSAWTGWNYVSGVCWSTEKEYLTIDVQSVVGVDSGELGTTVDVDQENKKITVSFSETVVSNLNDVVLKKANAANGGETVALTKKSTVGATTVFSYTDELDPSDEYVLILPEDAVGEKYGHKPATRYYYFTVDENYSVTTDKTYDFSTDEKSVDVQITNVGTSDQYVSGTTTYIGGEVVATGQEAYGNAIQVNNVFSHKSTTFGDRGEFHITKLSAPASGDIQAYSFDIKPLKPAMQVTIRIKSSSGTPLSLAFGKSGYILGGFNWFDKNSTTATDGATSNTNYIGSYNTTDWINFRMEFDKVKKIARIYVNGELKKTIQDSTATAYGGIGAASIITWGCNMTDYAAGEALFLMDNVRSEVVSRPVAVSKLRFSNADETLGAFAVSEKPVSSVALTFSEDVELTNAQSEDIKLYYDSQEISYTAAYNADTLCYTMTPASNPIGGQKVSVEVSGLTTADYLGYITIKDFEPEAAIVGADGAAIQSVAANGTCFVKVAAENYTGITQNILLVIAQYKEDALVSADVSNTYSVANGSSLAVDYNSENKISVTPDAEADEIKVFVWDTIGNLKPLCDEAVSVTITK